MTCTITANIAGPCFCCDKPLGVDEKAHLIDTEIGQRKEERLGIYCTEHCPIHSTEQPKEWEGEPVTVSGEQEVLF